MAGEQAQQLARDVAGAAEDDGRDARRSHAPLLRERVAVEAESLR